MMDTMEDKSLCGLIKFHSARLAEVAKDTEELQASIDNEVAKAYQKGFEDGKKKAESSDHIKKVEMDAFNKGMLFKEEKINDAFKRGFEKGRAVNDKGCTGCKYDGRELNKLPCMVCSNSRKNCWTAKSDKIEVGDEVADKDGDKTIVTNIHGDLFDGLCSDGSTMTDLFLDDNHKTGRHFNIASILEDMRK